jgi:MoxR-like ATPase
MAGHRLLHEGTELTVVLQKQGRGQKARIRAIPSSPSETFSSDIFVDPGSFRDQRAALEETWVVEVKPKGTIFVATLKSRISDRLISNIPGHWIQQDTLQDIQFWLGAGVHVCFLGWPGCGKTTLMERLALAKGWEFAVIDCGNAEKVRDWFGRGGAKKGSTDFAKSHFVELLEQAKAHPDRRFAVGWDEINRVHGSMHNALLPIFDARRSTKLTTSEGTLEIIVPTNVVFMATKNDESKDSGAYKLGNAFLNRMQLVEIPFMPEGEESLLLVNEVGIGVDDATLIVKIANRIRQGNVTKAFSVPMPSPRDTISAAILVRHGRSVEYAATQTFLPGLSGDVETARTPKAGVMQRIKAVVSPSPDA